MVRKTSPSLEVVLPFCKTWVALVYEVCARSTLCVFVAVDDFDKEASLALLAACEEGDVEAVRNALKNPRVDINFMVRMKPFSPGKYLLYQ